MKKGGITRSTGFQVVLYFLLAAGAMCGGFCIIIMLWLFSWGAYGSSFEKFEESLMASEAYDHLHYICYGEYSFPTIGEMVQAFNQESANNNVKYAIYRVEDNELVWTNRSSIVRSTYYVYTTVFHRPIDPEFIMPQNENVEVNYELVSEDVEYRAELYLERSFTKECEFKEIHETAEYWYEQKDMVWMMALGGCLLVLFCFIWILCNAGHGWRREGILPGVFSNIYLDIFTVVWGVVTFFALVAGVALFDEIYTYPSDIRVAAIVISVGIAAGAVWCTIYLRELALRFKLGKWWKHTLVYGLGRLFVKMLRFLWKCAKKLVVHFPEIHLVIFAVLVLTLCEFIGLALFRWDRDMVFILWFLEKLVVIPVILYCALAFQKLRKGSRALAQGNLSQKLDMQYLVLHFREHAEDLNQIGSGISKAVEERLQSERLKTELITNVSHDLKTPLTSVINYADLLATAAAGDAEDREKELLEYSEVLLRQSKRLKKLLEDLVEASKAATGNVELHPVPCELGVMLTQTVGEYEEKFAAKGLKLVMKKPEEELYIMADGRQLWRVFENLMSNICKYAQEGSRVYLNMEQKEQRVEVVFRNISKYELEISPEELTERFVRGDASRHMEGSGLGLSIAKSLVELQGGTMHIVTDGDLFKVVLSFELFKE